jgi:hypothetical protein
MLNPGPGEVWCEAEDEEGDPLQYEWKAEGISLGNGSSGNIQQAPGGNYP